MLLGLLTAASHGTTLVIYLILVGEFEVVTGSKVDLCFDLSFYLCFGMCCDEF